MSFDRIDRSALRRIRKMQAWPPALRRADRLVRKALGISAVAGACFALGVLQASSPQAAVSARDVKAAVELEIGRQGMRAGVSLDAKSFSFSLGEQKTAPAACPVSVPAPPAEAEEDAGGPRP